MKKADILKQRVDNNPERAAAIGLALHKARKERLAAPKRGVSFDPDDVYGQKPMLPEDLTGAARRKYESEEIYPAPKKFIQQSEAQLDQDFATRMRNAGERNRRKDESKEGPTGRAANLGKYHHLKGSGKIK